MLWLSDNKLTGKITSELGNLFNLESLGLSENQLTGSLPEEIGYLKLFEFEIYNNDLSGSYPETYQNLCNTLNAFSNSNEIVSDGNKLR